MQTKQNVNTIKQNIDIFNIENLWLSTKINYRRAGELLHRLVENEHGFITKNASALLGKSVSFVEALNVEYKNLFDKSDERYEYAIMLDRDIEHYWERRKFAIWYCVTYLNVPMEDLFWSESELVTESEILD